jgi:hypothetical protein
MRKPVTPGRLALIGAVMLLVLVAGVFTTEIPQPPVWAILVWLAVGLLLLIAGAVAKVVQIGVRSAQDQRGM